MKKNSKNSENILYKNFGNINVFLFFIFKII